jgi:hypothetical protein
MYFWRARAVRFTGFLAVILTALSLVPGVAHLIELPNKIGLGQQAYFTVQQIYAGWDLFGAVLIAALAANLSFTIMLLKLGRPFGYALAAFLLVAANLAIFFIWTFPANQATSNWTVAPGNWSELRMQWEYSHAFNALVMATALVCVVAAVRRHPRKTS